MRVTADLYELKPTLQSWVPHIAVFIVLWQTLPLGDPSRRSCDACESVGALLKKKIKHLTFRRRIRDSASTHGCVTVEREVVWQQSFSVGYIEQVFSRACVSEIRHGAENEPFFSVLMQSTSQAKGQELEQQEVVSDSAEPAIPPSVRDAIVLKDG
eukprot:385830-Pleurochrysis_carterae.AAC.1